MSLIRCDDDCLYQIDGYCNLETPTVITNHSGGCIHYIARSQSLQKELNIALQETTNSPTPQTLPEGS